MFLYRDTAGKGVKGAKIVRGPNIAPVPKGVALPRDIKGVVAIKVGDKICIIPNHSCSSANLTSYLIGIRNDEVDHLITVDIRGNSTRKNA